MIYTLESAKMLRSILASLVPLYWSHYNVVSSSEDCSQRFSQEVVPQIATLSTLWQMFVQG